jgi:hypothetical protein
MTAQPERQGLPEPAARTIRARSAGGTADLTVTIMRGTGLRFGKEQVGWFEVWSEPTQMLCWTRFWTENLLPIDQYVSSLQTAYAPYIDEGRLVLFWAPDARLFVAVSRERCGDGDKRLAAAQASVAGRASRWRTPLDNFDAEIDLGKRLAFDFFGDPRSARGIGRIEITSVLRLPNSGFEVVLQGYQKARVQVRLSPGFEVMEVVKLPPGR